MLLDGVHVPLTVPFYGNGESYLRKLEHNVRRYCLGPVAGLVALVPGSEAAALTEEEQIATLRAVTAAARAETVLIAGVQRESVHAALALARQAYDLRFDAVLLGVPPHWARLRGGITSTGELLIYFQSVADQSPLPVVLWSEAREPGLQLPLELLETLAHHENILGVYDADLTAERFASLRERTASRQREVTVTPVFAPVTRRMLDVNQAASGSFVPAAQLGGGVAVGIAPPRPVLRTRTRSLGFQVMAAGRVRGAAQLLAEGVPGIAPILAACAPQACHEVYAAFKDGTLPLAAEKEARLIEGDSLVAEFGPAGVKYACDLNGFYGGPPRLPRLGLTAEERGRVERAMRFVRH